MHRTDENPVRKVRLHLAVVFGEVVLAETRSAKELFDLLFFPLRDVRTEYLTPARQLPERDEIGESMRVAIEIAGKVVCDAGARFYYRTRPSYRSLKEHILFAPPMIETYHGDGGMVEIRQLYPRHRRVSVPERGGEERCA